MKKKIVTIGLIICSSIYIFGCQSEKGDKEEKSTEITSTVQSEEAGGVDETTEEGTENATEDTTEEATDEVETDEGIGANPDNDVTEGILIDREEKEDGSIYVKVTNDEEMVLQTVEYIASEDKTIKYAYEYNDKGALAVVYDFEGPGNLVEEFLEDDYSNATMSGMNNHEGVSDYEVDLDAAFQVTIKELEPLYKRAEEMYKKYGVAILIADKVCSYTSGAEQCYDYDRINNSLELIEECLKCYPEGFFKEFNNDWIRKTVCIQVVGTGGPAGVYFGDDSHEIVQIDVNDYTPEEDADNGTFFCYTLHHEIGHMISYTLLDAADRSPFPLLEDRWNSFNPDDFEYVGYYDDEKEIELFSYGDNSEYFVYSYSCSTPEEDRAIIFGKAMTYYMGREFMAFNDNIDAKLVYFSGCIKNVFMWIDWDVTPAWEYILED